MESKSSRSTTPLGRGGDSSAAWACRASAPGSSAAVGIGPDASGTGLAVAEELREVILDELVFLLPEQREQVITGVRGQKSRLIDHLQEPGDSSSSAPRRW